MLNTSKITLDLDSPYKKTYVYIYNFLLEGDRPKITMESDSPYVISYVYICPMYVYLLYQKKIGLWTLGGGGAKNRF